MVIVSKQYGITDDDFNNELVAFCKDVMNNTVEDDISIIKKYSKSDISIDDIYRFPIYLCDNEIDRENEMLTIESLNKVADMMVGKPGILSHDYSTLSNHSRIYKTVIMESSTLNNISGDKLTCVVGFAFTPYTDNNKDFVNNIDMGIFKEVSLGFKGVTKCSICGSVMNEDGVCVNGHIKGNSYNIEGVNLACIGITTDVSDCFEWSFVPVPCIKNAGVIHTKNYKGDDFVAGLTDKDARIAELEGIVADLKAKLVAKDTEFIEYKKGCSINKAIEDMKPVNEVAAEMARQYMLDSDKLEFDEEGTITKGLDVVKDELLKDRFFLFKPDDTTEVIVEDADDKVDETVVDDETVENETVETETETVDTKAVEEETVETVEDYEDEKDDDILKSKSSVVSKIKGFSLGSGTKSVKNVKNSGIKVHGFKF